MRELEAGEVVVANERRGRAATTCRRSGRPARCAFEHVYFARPDSIVFGDPVARVRQEMGAQLAREAPADADVVVPVPDSGVQGALGYSRESGLPYDMGLIRNHYVGRTFIEPQQSIRHFGVRVKLNPVRSVIKGRKVVLVDDSIIRGTTSRKIVRMVRDAGAAEVHLRIPSPPTRWPCYYGIDTPTREELIASSHDPEEIRRFVEADSLAYLSLAGNAALPLGRRRELLHRLLVGRVPGLARGQPRAAGRALPDPHGQRRVSDASARTSPRRRTARPASTSRRRTGRWSRSRSWRARPSGPRCWPTSASSADSSVRRSKACASRCWWRRRTASAPS